MLLLFLCFVVSVFYFIPRKTRKTQKKEFLLELVCPIRVFRVFRGEKSKKNQHE